MTFTRRSILAAAAALPATAVLAKAKAPARKPLRDMLVIDGLGGISDPYSPEDEVRLSPRAIAEMKASGVSAVDITILPVGNAPGGWDAMLQGLDIFAQIIAANPGYLMAIRKAEDFAAAKAKGLLGLYFGTQDTSMIGTQLDRLAELKAKGIRQVQLTYNLRNLSGDGSLEPADAGLSLLGRKTIERIEAERLVLDLSHGGARTQAEAAAMAKRPLLVSHTGCRALNDHPRNTSDAVMRAVADKGGCVGIYFMPYLAADSHPSGEQLVDHLVHAVNICGEDHVSIGTDGPILPTVIDDKARAAQKAEYEDRKAAGFAAPGEGPDVFPLVMDYNSIDKFERLALALSRRGWSDARIEKLLGANLLRVFGEVWG